VAKASATGRTDLTSKEWDPWIRQVCEGLGVDPAHVDVALVHELTKNIAHRFARPMAPVGSYIMGIALGAALARGEGEAADLLAGFADEIERTLPAG